MSRRKGQRKVRTKSRSRSLGGGRTTGWPGCYANRGWVGGWHRTSSGWRKN